MGVRTAAALLLAVLAPAGARPALAMAAPPGSPEALLEEIDRLGAHAVVSELYEDLAAKIDAQLTRLRQVIDTDVPAFNALVREQNVPAVVVKPTAK